MSALVAPHENARDRGLVERHQSGDDEAFAELYRLHFARLVRYCRRHLRDPHLAEEIAQDAFVRAYVALDGLAGERRFYPWLSVIAHRLIIDHIRRHGRVTLEADIDTGVAAATDDLVVMRQDRHDLQTALERLRERHREILRLRDYEGLSYDEIATRLGLPSTAVPPLLHRARAALRREFELVSEGRVAAFLHLPALLLLARRSRDRLAMWITWVPEPATFGAPLAGAVLALAGVAMSAGIDTFASFAGDGAEIRATTSANPAALHEAQAESRQSADEVDTKADVHRRLPHPHPEPVPRHVMVPQVAEAYLGNDYEESDRIRREGQDDPVYIDGGPVGIASDPEEDAEYFRDMAEQFVP
jgi:RNA polymerase sigma-70 factor (ECF subfamily)